MKKDLKLLIVGRSEYILGLVGVGLLSIIMIMKNNSITFSQTFIITTFILASIAFMAGSIWSGIFVWKNYTDFLSYSFFYRNSNAETVFTRLKMTWEFSGYFGAAAGIFVADIICGIALLLH